MKKKLLFTVLPLLLLGSCSSKEAMASYVISTYEGVPSISKAPNQEHVTYLMMSRYGYLHVNDEDVYGKDVESKFYENCIVWAFDAGDPLPSKEEVKSKVDGVTFRGWAQYNGNVYPEYLETVPTGNGETVYAIFDGTSGGGGGGIVTDSYSVTFQVNLSLFNGWEDITNFSLYIWGENGQEPLGSWDACAGNLTGEGDIKSVTASNITYRIVGAVFYFDQNGGSTPGRKQTTDMSFMISEEGTYNIAPTSSKIEWNSENKMSNFTITKA